MRDQVNFSATIAAHADVVSTGEIDLSTWPPIYRAHLNMLGIRVARARDGRFGALGVTVPDPEGVRPGTLRVREGSVERILDDAVPASVTPHIFRIDGIGFIGEDLVLLPSELTYREDNVKRPLVLRPKAKKFVELDQLPAVKVTKKFSKNPFPTFAVHGFAHTGNGEDVLLWGDGGYVGRTYKRIYDLGKLAPYAITSAPGAGDTFFVSNVGAIFEIRVGAKRVKRLSKAGRIESIVPGPDGVVLATIVRTQRKSPIMAAWWPEAREWAAIRGEMFGFTGSGWFSQGHIGFNPTSGLVWGFEPIREELRAIRWDVVAALKRLPE